MRRPRGAPAALSGSIVHPNTKPEHLKKLLASPVTKFYPLAGSFHLVSIKK
jgi:hypothetical protein